MDFTSFLNNVSGMESSFGKSSSNLYGMTAAAGDTTPLALAQSNYASLTKSLGQAPTDFQQYMGWNQGASGAAALFAADPNALASSVVPLKNLTGNIGASSGLDPATMTVSDFLGNMSGRWSKAGGTSTYSGGSTGAGTSSAASGAGTAATGAVDWIADYFLRAVIIILGFIFVNSGLRMFGTGVPVMPEGEALLPRRPVRVRQETVHRGELAPLKMEPAQLTLAGRSSHGQASIREERRRAIQGFTIRQVAASKRRAAVSKAKRETSKERVGISKGKKKITIKATAVDA